LAELLSSCLAVPLNCASEQLMPSHGLLECRFGELMLGSDASTSSSRAPTGAIHAAIVWHLLVMGVEIGRMQTVPRRVNGELRRVSGEDCRVNGEHRRVNGERG
jgi:hypothetical protein